MAELLITLDDDLKKEADSLFSKFDMTTQAAVELFIREALRRQGFPFTVSTDPFYSDTNISALECSLKQADKGEFVKMTLGELKEIEGEDSIDSPGHSPEAALEAIQSVLVPLAEEEGILTDNDVIAMITEYRNKNQK